MQSESTEDKMQRTTPYGSVRTRASIHLPTRGPYVTEWMTRQEDLRLKFVLKGEYAVLVALTRNVVAS